MTVESGFEYIYIDWFPTHESKDTNLVSCFFELVLTGMLSLTNKFEDIKYYVGLKQ